MATRQVPPSGNSMSRGPITTGFHLPAERVNVTAMVALSPEGSVTLAVNEYSLLTPAPLKSVLGKQSTRGRSNAKEFDIGPFQRVAQIVPVGVLGIKRVIDLSAYRLRTA